ncbi:hypothetical protein KSP24_24990 [Paenibacillus sp. AK121]|uniref:hypothetical protein n=1 Tax=Paenibacillus sp. AK121 TaxID=2849670 RepID=UPI001C242FE2|nr:hypothetical protein [Paenibacillus sp. AK121]MBU9710132.1 hypothetical protein [Paenibacillus sp. AK121]
MPGLRTAPGSPGQEPDFQGRGAVQRLRWPGVLALERCRDRPSDMRRGSPVVLAAADFGLTGT